GLASQVLVQTRYPEHPLLAAVARHDFAAFARQQLAERKAAGLPPFVHHALLTAEARTLAAALEFLGRARVCLTAAPGLHLYDAVPMPLVKLAGVHRAQLLVESAQRARLQAWLRDWLAAVRRLAQDTRPRVRWQIEVDPQQI
ncbi:MAG: primosomal protein N', partial [Burkholderiaceae bacterium]|nr:primosomal protein N' [Burkholderiaceae bacterium]